MEHSVEGRGQEQFYASPRNEMQDKVRGHESSAGSPNTTAMETKGILTVTHSAHVGAWGEVQNKANLIDRGLEVICGYRPHGAEKDRAFWFVLSCALHHMAARDFGALRDGVTQLGLCRRAKALARIWVERRYRQSLEYLLRKVAYDYRCSTDMNALFFPIAPLKASSLDAAG